VPAEKIGLAELVEQGVQLARNGAHGGTKALPVVGWKELLRRWLRSEAELPPT
jgi:hypothetical protein